MVYGKRKINTIDKSKVKRQKKNSSDDTEEEEGEETNNIEVENGNEERQECDVDALIAFIQTCKLPYDEAKIKKKFDETVQMRKEMDFDEYKSLFNLYLICPNLVKQFIPFNRKWFTEICRYFRFCMIIKFDLMTNHYCHCGTICKRILLKCLAKNASIFQNLKSTKRIVK